MTQCAHVKRKIKNKRKCGEAESEMVHCVLTCAYMCVIYNSQWTSKNSKNYNDVTDFSMFTEINQRI